MGYSRFTSHLDTGVEGVLIAYKPIIHFIDPCASSVEMVVDYNRTTQGKQFGSTHKVARM